MSNSIDQNYKERNNSISSLSFHWLAIFKDGTYINQFQGEEEHKFQEVIDKFKDLQVFILHHSKTHDKFIVDLEKGFICKDKPIKLNIEEKKKNIRLIFFRRHKVELTESLKEQSHIIEYHLGFQYNDKDDHNRQIVLQIDDEGNWIIGV
jgi:hypothetical protein